MFNYNPIMEDKDPEGFRKLLLDRLKEIETPHGHQPYDNLQIQAMYHFASYLDVFFPDFSHMIDEKRSKKNAS